MTLLGSIEAILFVASKPLSTKQIAKALDKQIPDIEEAIQNLVLKYHQDDSGIHILVSEDMVQMGTNPDYAESAEKFIKSEAMGELTKAQLETLTVIAYRGPVSRPELEQIRGVNCSVILRNLRMRGLLEEGSSDEHVLPVYTLSLQALAHLGVTSVHELPQYEALHIHEHLDPEALDARQA